MSDNNRGRLDQVSPQDVAWYVGDVAAQLAHMARAMSLGKLGELLDEAVREAERHARDNAGPDDQS